MSTQTNGIIHIGNFKIDKNNVLGKGATGLVYKGFFSYLYQVLMVITMSQ